MSLQTEKEEVGPFEERELLGMIASEVEKFYGVPNPEFAEDGEWVYLLDKSCFGIISKELHLYFFLGRVVDYRIHIYFLGICIT
jgi:hypothetical protein